MFFFKHQVSCVNGFLTGNARKQSGALQIKKRLLQYIFSLIKTELLLDFPLLLSPLGFGENTPPLNTLSLTLCIYMSDSFVVYLHQFFISGRRKKNTFNRCFIKYVYVCFCCAIQVQTLHFSWQYRWELGQFKHRFIIPSANLNYFPKGFSCLYVSYLKFFNRNPTISWKVL